MPISPAATQHGILLVHKPEGISSAGLVARIKRITGAKKVGHAGTLDPFARGLMVCGINHGTRLSRFFLHGDKTYTAELTFGRETDTMDRTGCEVQACAEDFFEHHPDFFSKGNQICLLDAFKGPQNQLPPVYSALKHQGVPLYKLARKGTPVQKEARSIVIKEINLLGITPPSVTFSVQCTAGTYIRSLASDMGKKAGCGAHLSALERTETCGFSLNYAIDLDTLAQATDWSKHLISMDDALPNMTPVFVDETLAEKVKHGVLMTREEIGPDIQDCFLKVLDKERTVIAILEYDNSKSRYNYCCVFHD
ncbi:MAG: tRNA pseudouridine(55) synthase TruB [Proteobacteria bacterium]|nr:tRNA pseudouridine(55) synthase TruB [Pseudomonadota bacterium]